MKLKTYLGSEWTELLGGEFRKKYIKRIEDRLVESDRTNVYPPLPQVFDAYNFTPPQNVKVVILGQDPYHGKGQANGLAFSVNKGLPITPELRNIFREVSRDTRSVLSGTGDLKPWATEGVLLLNSILTVDDREPNSWAGVGWEKLTGASLEAIAAINPVVFMLWGRSAEDVFSRLDIDQTKHLVLRSSHPSPLSYKTGFENCGHFRAANEWLEAKGRGDIDWSL